MTTATLTVDFVAQLSDLRAGLNRMTQLAESSAKRIGTAFTGLGATIGGALSVGAVVAWGKAINGALEELDDLAEITGESVENLSEMAAQARVSGAEMNTVVQFANRLAKGLSAADDETKGVGRALRALGVDARSANGELKNTPELMREIAVALQRFREGPAKQALIQELGGLRAANLIPFLNDLASAGEINARVTAEQAAAAEQLGRAFRLLAVEADGVGRDILVAVTPALESLARGVTDVIAANRGLAGDETLARWADRAAIGAAVVVDALAVIPRTLAAVGDSFRAVLADIGVVGATVQSLAALDFGPLREALARRNETLREANKTWAELWTYNGRQVEEAVRRQQRLLSVASEAVRDFARNADARDLRLQQKVELQFSVASESENEVERKAQAFLERLQKQAQTLELGEVAMLRVEAAQLRVTAAAEPWIQRLERARALQEQIRIYMQEAERAEREQARLTERRVDLSGRAQELEQEADLVGRSRAEIAALTEARRLDAQMMRDIAGAEGEQVAALIALYDEFRGRIVAAARAREEMAQRRRMSEFGESLAAEVEEIQFATSLIGRNRREIELLTAARRVDRQAAETLRDVEGEALQEGIALWQQYRASVLEALEEQQKVAASLEPLMGLADDLGEAFGRALSFDAGKLRADLDQLGRDILNIITRRLVSEPLAETTSEFLRNAFRQAAAGAGNGAGGSGGGLWSAFAAWLRSLTGYASGGYMRPGELGWVGERGPELAYAGRTGLTVMPVERVASEPVRSTQVNVYLPAGAPVTQATAQQVGAAAARAILQAHRRLN